MVYLSYLVSRRIEIAFLQFVRCINTSNIQSFQLLLNNLSPAVNFSSRIVPASQWNCTDFCCFSFTKRFPGAVEGVADNQEMASSYEMLFRNGFEKYI